MKRALTQFLSILPLVALLCTSCATGAGAYWKDRDQDAADIFSVSVGKGSGIKARIGPLQAGHIDTQEKAGIRGGEAFFIPEGEVGPEDSFLKGKVRDQFSDHRHVHSNLEYRHKRYYAMGTQPIVHPLTKNKYTRLYYHTQLELAAGYKRTLRLGFNPLELFDFFAGFFTYDIFDDDLNTKIAKEALKASQPKMAAHSE